jgi:hypothetical protein
MSWHNLEQKQRRDMTSRENGLKSGMTQVHFPWYTQTSETEMTGAWFLRFSPQKEENSKEPWVPEVGLIISTKLSALVGPCFTSLPNL